MKGQTLINTNFVSDSYTPFEAFPDVLTVEQLQNALGIGRSTAYKIIHNKEIGYLRIGTAIKIPKTSLISYVEENLETCYDISCNGQVNRAVRKGIM